MTQQPDIQATTALFPLRIRPVRLFGRRVNGCAVRIPASGLVMGGENGALSLDAALHVLPHHAEVRVEMDAFCLAPGCGVVALNGERLGQHDSRALHPGDRVEIGFATLLVEVDDMSPLHGCDGACDSSGMPAGTPKLVPGFLPGFIPTKPQAPPTQQEPAEEQPASAEAEALLALLLTEARENVSESTSNGSNEGVEAQNTVLERIATMPELTDTGICAHEQSSSYMVEHPQNTPAEPHNSLAALTAESARVLAGGRMEATMPFAAQPAVPVPFAESSPERLDFPLPDQTAASSLEEILEGPISIDDVLENLRRRSPNPNQHDAHAVTDVLAAMAEPPRAPDPLRLLAGLAEQPPLREPELPPVLGREHRSPGMHTPYAGGISGILEMQSGAQGAKAQAFQEEPRTDNVQSEKVQPEDSPKKDSL